MPLGFLVSEGFRVSEGFFVSDGFAVFDGLAVSLGLAVFDGFAVSDGSRVSVGRGVRVVDGSGVDVSVMPMVKYTAAVPVKSTTSVAVRVAVFVRVARGVSDGSRAADGRGVSLLPRIEPRTISDVSLPQKARPATRTPITARMRVFIRFPYVNCDFRNSTLFSDKKKLCEHTKNAPLFLPARWLFFFYIGVYLFLFFFAFSILSLIYGTTLAQPHLDV